MAPTVHTLLLSVNMLELLQSVMLLQSPTLVHMSSMYIFHYILILLPGGIYYVL